MADRKQGSDGSAEEVAFRLLEVIAFSQGKVDEGRIRADRRWILDNYAECLKTVLDPDGRLRAGVSPVEATIERLAS